MEFDFNEEESLKKLQSDSDTAVTEPAPQTSKFLGMLPDDSYETVFIFEDPAQD